MPTPTLPESTLRRTVKILEECGWNRSAAGRRLKLNESTIRRHAELAVEQGLLEDLPPGDKGASRRTVAEPDSPALDFPSFPAEELPADELVDLMKSQFRREHLAHRSRKWFDIRVNIPGPIGIMWFGDPHVDSQGCNWPLLDAHAKICRDTEGMFGANIGDTTDNWVGRLARLYAHSNQSRSRAVRLAEIFIAEMGIDWLLLLRGNHDMWSQSRQDDPLTWFKRGGAPMEDWQARFSLLFPNDRRARIWAAHDFPGHSWFNPTHGNKRASLRDQSHLYICGHRHNWALHCEENADTNEVYWFARARGYKYIDHHGENLGHEAQMEGACIVSVIDPDSVLESGFVQCFSDPHAAADFLTYKRRKAAA